MEELKRIVVEGREDGTQISRLPNNEEIMNKINELIRYTKRLDKNKQSKTIKGVGTVTHRSYC
ncbi:hypothetical protein CN604_18675 [Bacillus wiedmannii]|uniref:hypothetical protein n=1 Tax=Bacillus wiedmannii TaxID=1890302 RepID=UPI000BF17D41|nr:hypothetical protein [Bacillus wiedmannii]PEL97689.1 hypothetical protein CN604_18675 [Bacillus wiedmannii]